MFRPPLFCLPAQVKIADGRPADVLWVLLSKQVADVVYTLHENTVRRHDMLWLVLYMYLVEKMYLHMQCPLLSLILYTQCSHPHPSMLSVLRALGGGRRLLHSRRALRHVLAVRVFSRRLHHGAAAGGERQRQRGGCVGGGS